MDCFIKNVGVIDRGVRIVVGLAAVYGYVSNVLEAPLSYLLLLVALVAFFTALTGSCMLYSLLGINTGGESAKEKPSPAAKAKKSAKAKKRK